MGEREVRRIDWKVIEPIPDAGGMDEMTAWLRVCVDDDEAAAKACQSPAPWRAATHESDSWIVTDATGEALIYDEGAPSLQEAAHIALHDPARVLREVAAKRAILAEHEHVPVQGTPFARGGFGCQVCHEQDLIILANGWCKTVRHLTAVYSDRPGYRESWHA